MLQQGQICVAVSRWSMKRQTVTVNDMWFSPRWRCRMLPWSLSAVTGATAIVSRMTVLDSCCEQIAVSTTTDELKVMNKVKTKFRQFWSSRCSFFVTMGKLTRIISCFAVVLNLGLRSRCRCFGKLVSVISPIYIKQTWRVSVKNLEISMCSWSLLVKWNFTTGTLPAGAVAKYDTIR